ncbi:MAG: ACP S-malonyltransferase [Deltaproteobacteria bacterium]|nr:ACP S-malonyltransferase [Deltaproteobacteria bacterium]
MEKQSTAVVFPGQGSQCFGMGKEFFDQFPESRAAFQEASEALMWDTAAMCFSQNPSLNLTEFAQPLILTTEIAMFRGLCVHYGLTPSCYGGHSLGEYAALVAAGVMPLGIAAQLVSLRGKLMQTACPQGTGGMAAVIARNIGMEEIQAALADLPLDVANVNYSGQIVIGGLLRAFGEAEKRLGGLLDNRGDWRFVPLNVSAPFHSRFMAPVCAPFGEALEDAKINWDTAKARNVTSNVTGLFHEPDSQRITDALTLQVSRPVLWENNMEALMKKATQVVEIGPARPLSGFFRSIGIDARAVTSLATARRAFENREAA